MKLLLKTVAAFAVIGLLVLLVLSYLENEHGLKTNASEVLHNIEAAGNEAMQSTENFLETSGIKAGAEKLLDQAAALIEGENAEEPGTTAGPSQSTEEILPDSEPETTPEVPG